MLEFINFDKSDLEAKGEYNGALIWWTPDGDLISAHYFGLPPDIGASLDAIDDLRQSYRELAAGKGLGVIAIERLECDGLPVVKTIFKAPQEPSGMTYLGSLTFPFRDFSYVLKMQCQETGTTGIRDTMVLIQSGIIARQPPGSDRLEGWMSDPYDPTIQMPLMMNLSEDEAYDARFPDHPLSRLRRRMAGLEGSVRLAPEVRGSPPYVYTGPAPIKSAPMAKPLEKRPWWKRGLGN